MKISHNWLQQFLKVDLSIDKIAEMLTDLGLEVEGTSHFSSIPGGLSGVVVGEVLSCSPHPNADRLKVTTVDIGTDEPLPIVCGAPNVAAGQKVPVATVGTTLYDSQGDSFVIKKSKIRGEVSQGMICAEDELSLGTSHDGIMVLDAALQPGTPCSTVFSVETDTVFEIGLTPNRADAMSHLGVARDLRAACVLHDIKTEWNTPEISSFSIDQNTHPITIEVKDTDKCPSYLGLMIRNVTIAPSPAWLQNRLKALGLTPKNNVVDITNYVLHDLGQPLHAFDAGKIQNKVVVQCLPQDTPFVTLDGENRKLNAEDLMICDGDTPLCIAGVFGGLHSGVTDNTQHIFLESAYFNPVSIRKTAKRHGLNTDASFRFERGIDPNITAYALKRAGLLIKELAGGSISSELIEVSEPAPEPLKVFVNFDQLNSTVGQEIPKEKLTIILNALEMTLDSVSEAGIGLSIPPYRVDVTRPSDVIEEILRVYGYNNITATPALQMPFPQHEERSPHRIGEEIAKILVGFGYQEIMNNSLTSPAYQQLDSSLKELQGVHLINPLGQELSQLRSSLLFSCLESVGFNLNRQAKTLKLFEMGKVYRHDNQGYKESKILSLVLVGKPYAENWNSQSGPSTFSYAKGTVESLLLRLGISISDCNTSDHPTFSEGICWTTSDNEWARLGIIKKEICEAFSIEKSVYYIEMNLDLLIDQANRKTVSLEDIPKYPSMRRDFALLVDKEVSFKTIENLAYKTERKLLRKVGLFDVYEGKNLEANQKSYGVSFEFQDAKRTMTDKQVDKIMKKLEQQFAQELQATLR